MESQRTCKMFGCEQPAHENSMHCATCIATGATATNTPPKHFADVEPSAQERLAMLNIQIAMAKKKGQSSLADKYPKYHKRIPEGWTTIDVYGVCQLFPIDDPSGTLNHARKKLLVPGTRTGGKSFYKDIQEARDTLNRWLEMNVPGSDVA